MDQLLSEDDFGALLEQRVRGLERVELRGREELELRLLVGGREVNSQADAFYRAYRLAPDRLEEVLAAYAQLIREELPAPQAAARFADLAARVYPMIKRPDLLLTVRERKLPMLAWTPFLADLIITYVVDQQGSVSYLNEEQLERWELSEQQLHQAAVENLRRRTVGAAQVTSVGEGAQRLFIYSTMDGYDATRILLPDQMAEWEQELPGRTVLGIPNRDFLIAFSDDDPGVLQAIARQVQLDSVGREHGLTDQLFTLHNGRVEEYEW
jgi:uncharacterized protein YtpQ (UPF0354 family)